MLDEYKEIYKNNASLLPNWENIDRNDLCNMYLEIPDSDISRKNSCLSAIIYKFWNTLSKHYYSQDLRLAQEEDCYDWIIETVLYVLGHHVWTDPKSTLYNDPKGPEKAFSIKVKCLRLNYYVYTNRQKRKLNYNNFYNIDDVEENPYINTPLYEEDLNITTKFIHDKFVDYFNKKDYVPAFILDSIVYNNMFSTEVDDNGNEYLSLNKKRVKHHLKFLDKNYCKIVSECYNIDYDKVLKSIEYIVSMSSNQLDGKINNVLFRWSKDKEFIKYLRG